MTDLSGCRGGQQLLNEFVEQLALDLPRFMQASSREKANTLLQIIGLREQLAALEGQEQDLYNRRRSIGQIATQKAKYAEELPFDPTAPTEPVSVSELIRQQQEILAQNGENQRKRAQAASLQAEKERREALEKAFAACDMENTGCVPLVQLITYLGKSKNTIRDYVDEHPGFERCKDGVKRVKKAD